MLFSPYPVDSIRFMAEIRAEKVVKSRHFLPLTAGGVDFSFVFRVLVQRHDLSFLFYNETGYKIILWRGCQEQKRKIRENLVGVI